MNQYQQAWSHNKLTVKEAINIMKALNRGQIMKHLTSSTDCLWPDMLCGSSHHDQGDRERVYGVDIFLNEKMCGAQGCGGVLFTANKNYDENSMYGRPLWLHKVAQCAGYVHGTVQKQEWGDFVPIGQPACPEPKASPCAVSCGNPNPSAFDLLFNRNTYFLNKDQNGAPCNTESDFEFDVIEKNWWELVSQKRVPVRCRLNCFKDSNMVASSPTELAVACTGIRRGFYAESSR